MTKDEARALAKEIDNSISSEGLLNSSGYYVVCTENINETDYVGLVDVSMFRDEKTGTEEYNVYSVACELDGEDICEPDWDRVCGTIPSLADFLMRLANYSFSRSEIERLANL